MEDFIEPRKDEFHITAFITRPTRQARTTVMRCTWSKGWNIILSITFKTPNPIPYFNGSSNNKKRRKYQKELRWILTALSRHIFSLKDPRQPNMLMQNMMTPTTRRKKAGSVARLSNDPSLAFWRRAQMPIITRHIPPTCWQEKKRDLISWIPCTNNKAF